MLSAVYVPVEGSNVLEVPTVHLLKEVGLTLLSDDAPVPPDALTMPTFTSSFSYQVRVCGPGAFDVLDSASARIRVTLGSGGVAMLRGGVYVKAHTGPDMVRVLCGPGTLGSTNNKLVAFPAVAGNCPLGTNARELVCDLCAGFYKLEWVTGTGGSISIRHGERIFMAPSGVQKERIKPDDVFTLDTSGAVVYAPQPRPPRPPLRLSQCHPLFHKAFTLRNAGACIHTHSVNALMVTLRVGSEFRITHQEMIKGIDGHGFTDTLVVPVIENTPHERDLADSLGAAMTSYPKATAVLVRRHGIYVWGSSWESAKTQAECYHYLFDVALRMWDAGMDPAVAPTAAPAAAVPEPASAAKRRRTDDSFVGVNGSGGLAAAGAGGAAVTPSPKASLRPYSSVLLDIEGTTTPISFVSDVLFPYAAASVEDHLKATWGSEETKADVAALVAQAQADADASVEGVVPIPTAGGKDAVLAAVVANVRWQMSLNRKTGALKALQGHIWRQGYADGKLKGDLFPDVLPAMRAWVAAGKRVFIYSSGSREAQRLLFQYSNGGDATAFISAYFDTTSGPKREASSYSSIGLSLGADNMSTVLFVTDVLAEAVAAGAAGMQVAISKRVGNADTGPHAFPEVSSLVEL